LLERDALVFRCPLPEADLVAAMVYLPPIEKCLHERVPALYTQ
jgi:hypothetical protein